MLSQSPSVLYPRFGRARLHHRTFQIGDPTKMTSCTARAALAVPLMALSVLIAAPPAHAQSKEEPEAEEADAGEIVVQATRSGRRLKDESIRVEVLGGEEIEEKLLMSPGSIAMLLSETPGVQTQIVSPGLGAANIRIQGLKGRYTQLLADGLPLFGGQVPPIGIVQIPPIDLAQVELIKGAASALYGPSALGGVINLVSRRPGDEPEVEVLLNATSRNGQDVAAYGATPLWENMGMSLTGGYNRQTIRDLDGDGWADIPSFSRLTLRPRLFANTGGGASIMLTGGAMHEQRVGGTLAGRTVPDGTAFPLTVRSRRYDLGVTADIPIEGLGKLRVRASGVIQNQNRQFGTTLEDDRHRTVFAEASLSGDADGLEWLAGTAVQVDDYRSKQFSAFDYSYRVPAVFGQLQRDVGADLKLAGSARLDFHSDFGTHFSPRVSLTYHPGPWTVRGSFSSGFFAPTPFIEETEAAGLSRLAPIGTLRAETARAGSVDLVYAKGPLEVNVTLFGSDIDHAVQLRTLSPTQVALVNADGITRTRGGEFLARYRWDELRLSVSYAHVSTAEPDLDQPRHRTVPLTPRDAAGMTLSWEKPGRGRVGLEGFYVGRQSLPDNPFRQTSRPYVQIGAMALVNLGHVSLFANAENLLNVRQTKYNPLVLPGRAPSGSWTVDGWAPTDGIVFNAGVKFKFGGHGD